MEAEVGNIEIHIHGSYSRITGPYPKDLVKQVCSYPVQGHEFSQAFRKKLWDGRKHLFKPGKGTLPTGLVPAVSEALRASGEAVTVVDHRVPPTPKNAGFDLIGSPFTGKYDYQLEVVQKMVEAKRGVVKMATGSGKTECAAAVIQHLGLPSLFLVTSRELLYQAQNRFMKKLGLTEKEVGIIGDGEWKEGSLVTVAIIATLASRMDTKECHDFLNSIDVLFLDECHRAGSDSYYTVATLCSPFYCWGLSGTPLDRSDGADLQLIAATGDIIVDIPNKMMVERGITARADIIWDKITEPVLKKKIAYPSAYKQGVSENPFLLKKVVEWTKVFYEQGLSTLILCEEIAHGQLIDDALWTDAGILIPHQYIHGSESGDVRSEALTKFGNRELPVLVASRILDEGVDVPTIDALILAGSRKSRIATMQRLGRGLRGSKLIVVEFSNFCHKYLLEHSLKRYQDYKDEDCFGIYASSPDAALVKKLWSKGE